MIVDQSVFDQAHSHGNIILSYQQRFLLFVDTISIRFISFPQAVHALVQLLFVAVEGGAPPHLSGLG